MAKDQKINFYKTPAASAKDNFYLDVDGTLDDNNTPTRDFAPYGNFVIANTGSTKLKVFKNSSKAFDIVPNGAIVSFNALDRNQDGFINIRVENLSSSLAGEYYLTLDNSESMLSMLNKLVQVSQK